MKTKQEIEDYLNALIREQAAEKLNTYNRNIEQSQRAFEIRINLLTWVLADW